MDLATTGRRTRGRSAPRNGRSRRRLLRLQWTVGAIVGLVGFVEGILTTCFLAPLWSSNADEGVYLQQGTLLGRGHVRVPFAVGLGEMARPWFAVWTPSGPIYKYPPVWSSVIAVATLSRNWRLAAGLAGALFALGVFLVARAVLKSAGWSAVAVLIALASPLVVVLGAGLLPYVFFGGLYAIVLGLLLTVGDATEMQARFLALCAGFVGAVALIGRPFEGLLLVVPAFSIVIVAVRCRDRARNIIVFGALGAAVPIGLFVGYCRATSGRWFSYLYADWAPLDRLGFGVRTMLPSGTGGLVFGPADGLAATSHHLEHLVLWGPAPIIWVGLVLLGIWTGRRRLEVYLLVAAAVAVPLGFVFNWAIASAGLVWNSFPRFGPMYYVPTVAPLSVLATVGIRRLFRARAIVALGLVTFAILANIVMVARPVGVARRETVVRREVYSTIRSVLPTGKSVLLVPGPYPGLSMPGLSSFLGHKYSSVEFVTHGTPGGVGGPDSGDLAAADQYPDRPLYRVSGCGYFGGALAVRSPRVVPTADPRVSGRRILVKRVTVLEGSSVEADVMIRPLHGESHAHLDVTALDWRASGRISFDENQSRSIRVVLSPTGMNVDGASQIDQDTASSPSGTLHVTVSFADGRLLSWFAPLAVTGPGYRVVTPAVAYRRPAAGERTSVWCPGERSRMSVSVASPGS